MVACNILQEPVVDDLLFEIEMRRMTGLELKRKLNELLERPDFVIWNMGFGMCLHLHMHSYFQLKQNNTSVQTEVIAGISSFLATSYIIVVNPGISIALLQFCTRLQVKIVVPVAHYSTAAKMRFFIAAVVADGGVGKTGINAI